VKQTDSNNHLAQASFGAALGCIAFGVYLLAGAFRAFSGIWPGFLPPQVDGIALLLSVMTEPYATYAAGVVTGLIGIGCVGFGIWLCTRPAARQNKEAGDV
jgi:hypothetical protein